MKSGNKHSFHQTGFTMVEIMVGLAIGMLATVVIMQVFSVFEAQKRTTTGTADAQTNGSIALYNISREMQFAGFPLMPIDDLSPLECTTLTVNGALDLTVPNRLSPVAIADGGAAAGASDSITLRYGDSLMGGVSTLITGDPAASTLPAPAIDVPVGSNLGCRAGDIALSINGTTCAMSSVTNAASATPTTITLADNTAVTAGAAVAGANIACLGTWNEIVYAVNNGNLQRGGQDAVAGIVNLQAQYGISAAANSNQIVQWVNATAATGWNAPPTVADRNRIKAVRVAVVARNAKMEAGNVTAACNSTTVAAPTGLCAWAGSVASPAPVIDLSNDPNWARYRYRVFETIIPLRNVIWSRDKL